MATHVRSALVVVVVMAVALCSRTTDAFLFPTYSYAFAPSTSTRLASSFYDDMDYTAQRNQVQERPDWAGEGVVSSLVSALINNKFLYGFMKIGARKVLIDNAEKKGVAWRDDAQALLNDRRLPNTFSRYFGESHAMMDYPSYYTQPFHAYQDGNLNWLAAAEVESATSAMCLRVWPKDVDIQPVEAQDRLRDSYQKEIRRQIIEGGTDPTSADLKILDVGCSAGISTRYLRRLFPSQHLTGLDLSPFFLAVAQLREEETPMGIEYMHAKAEDTGLPTASFDVAALTFVVHELPSAATQAIAQEMFRVLRPGGTLAITDNDPRSPVIQGLPKPIALLMKSTEPFSDEYFTLDMERMLEKGGFERVKTVATDPRHRTILATKPK